MRPEFKNIQYIHTLMHTVVTVGFGAPSVTVAESIGTFSMRVRLNRLTAVLVTVTLVTENGTAVDGEGKVMCSAIVYVVSHTCTHTHRLRCLIHSLIADYSSWDNGGNFHW